MKCIFSLILFSLLQAHAADAYSQKRRVSLQLSHTTLENALSEIEKRTDLYFLYNNKLVDVKRRVEISAHNKDIEEVLSALFQGTDIRFRVVGNQVILAPPFAMAALAPPRPTTLATERQAVLTGRITDAENRLPLPGVSISIKGGAAGAVTDADGKYSLQVPDGNAVLVFSLMGYVTQEIPVAGRQVIEVALARSVKGLNEIVVVGYGTQQRTAVTGSVASVSAAEIKDLPVSAIDQSLAGRVAGVQISQASGTPGGGVKISIRGAGSIGAGNDPLYVIDGFPVMNFSDENNNLLSTIPPGDIASIEILKDASATAIYGSRGSNGVVLITTKGGKSGKAKVTVDAYYGLQQVRRESDPGMLNAREWAQFRKEAISDLVRFRENREPTDADIPEAYRHPEQYGEGTNWFREMTENAPMQSYNVSIDGGSETMRSRISLGYFNQDGVIVNTGYERFTASARVNASLGSKVNVGFNLRPSYIRHNYPFTTQYAFDLTASPLTPVKQPDGSFTPMADAPGMLPVPNPVYRLREVDNTSRRFRALLSAYVDYEILKDVHFKSTINVDVVDSKGQSFHPSYIGEAFRYPPVRASGTYFRSEGLNWLNENTLDIERRLGASGEHVIRGLLGFTVQKQYDESGSFTATDFPDDIVRTFNAAATKDGTTSIGKWSLLSYLARVNYSYRNKYLLTAAIRSDGSSRFGENNRWGSFPSVSAGWRITEEPFMKGIGWLNEWKIRAGYGFSGNFNIGNYTHLSQVGTDNVVFGNMLTPGSAIGTLGNTELGWEKSQQLDVGMDIVLLKGRVSLTLDYYRKITKDMLLNVEIPYTSGFGSATVNRGKLENKGFELAVHSNNLAGRFSWSTDFNISFNKNKVLALNGDNAPIYSGRTNEGSFTHITQVGLPMAQFYGFVFDGLYSAEDIADAKVAKYDGAIPGAVKYKDVNGDDVIKPLEDFAAIGTPWPNFTYGMTNTFSYRNFDLSVSLAGSSGGQLLKSYTYFLHNIDGVFNVTKDVLNRWRSPEQPGDGLHPTTNGLGTPNVLYRDISSLKIEDNAYLWVKNITIGYGFPQARLGRFFQSLRIYGGIQNAFLLTKYSGDNPEVFSNYNNALTPGMDFLSYPVPRTFTLGVNASF